MTSTINLEEIFSDKECSTKEKLIKEGILLFSKHGFEATTTRMLADAVGANNAAVYFHFGNKENLYAEILKTVAEYMKKKYQPLHDEIQQKRQQSPLSSYEAWLFIEKYVDLYISIIKNQKNEAVLYLLIHEQINPVNNQRPITEVACRQGENMLIQLLSEYWQHIDMPTAVVVSRLATSALVSLAEHPSFIRLALGLDSDAELSDEIWSTIRSYTLNSLKTFPFVH